MLTKKCTTNETMGCSGNGEHGGYICYFPSGTENIPESIEERNMNRKYIPTLLMFIDTKL